MMYWYGHAYELENVLELKLKLELYLDEEID